jgi:hypothetical protein
MFWVSAIGIAIVMSILSFFLRRAAKKVGVGGDNDRKSMNKTDKKYRWPAFALHIIALLAVFWLFDAEVERIFGIGFIANIGMLPSFLANIGSIFGGVVDPIAVLEFLPLIAGLVLVVVPFSLALFFFAIPVSIIVSSVIKVFGYRKVNKSVGKAVGALSIWFIGTGYITFFLNIIIQEVMPMLPF